LEAKGSPKNIKGDARNHWKFNEILENDVNTTKTWNIYPLYSHAKVKLYIVKYPCVAIGVIE
jgi:hypothetical protein